MLLGFVAAASLATAGCRTIREELPTGPDPGERDPASLIPVAPAPSPSVSPSPLPEDDPLPAQPGPGGDATATCGPPVPPPISRVNVRVLFTQPSRVVLDATPLVGPDVQFCATIGFTDGRSFCPVRPDGHPERSSCEALRVGRAADTGRFGPTWSVDGRPCLGPDGGGSCANHPDNQYFVYAYGTGTFRACVAGGACGERTLP